MRLFRRILSRLALGVFILFLLLIIPHFVIKKILYVDFDWLSKEMPVKHPPQTAGKIMSGTGIPKIIHLFWPTESIPTRFSQWIKNYHYQYPKWKIWFWTNDDVRRLINEKYSEYGDLYNDYKEDISRADVARYFIIYEYGGLFADMDIESLKPLDKVAEKFSCVMGYQPELHAKVVWHVDKLVGNAIMLCSAGHLFIGKILKNLKSNKGLPVLPFLKLNLPVGTATGPIMLSNMYETYAQTKDAQVPKTNITILHSKFFYPIIDSKVLEKSRDICANKENNKKEYESIKNTCHKLDDLAINLPTVDSYTMHHWTGGVQNFKSAVTVNIRWLLKGVERAQRGMDQEKEVKRRVNKLMPSDNR